MNLKHEFEMMLKIIKEKNASSLFEDKDFYADWLAQTYYFVIHSTSLLGYALPHLKNQALRHHFEHHLAEEERHDLLALKDMERMGKDISLYKEYSATQAFYQSQYYRISFEGGTSLLGYILFLEGLAVHWGQEIHQRVKDIHKNSVLFLKVHAEEDPKHLEDAIDTIQKLSIEEQEAVCRNLHYSYDMYQEMLNCIKMKMNKKIAA